MESGYHSVDEFPTCLSRVRRNWTKFEASVAVPNWVGTWSTYDGLHSLSLNVPGITGRVAGFN